MAFRILLILMIIVLSIYTSIVIAHHGINLLAVFFADMAAMAWPGQFNLDFMFFLILSALWVGWRNHFSFVGVGLMGLAFFGGMMFLAIYLLILSFQNDGDMKKIMLGDQRAA